MFLPRVRTYPLLLPLAWLYGLVVWLRNRAYDRGWLRSVAFDVPIIAVGNIAAGGTGKTPHTEYLVRLLRREGIGPIAILSRGYKRLTHGFVLAAEGTTAAQIGDEPYQMWRKFPDAIVAVDGDRVRGIQRLLALPVPPAVILLDDALQHRHLRPGLAICLTNYHRILYRDRLLPAGRLREPASGLRRADIAIVTKCPAALRDEEETEIAAHLPTRPGQPVYHTAYRYGTLVNLATGRPATVGATCQVLMVTGIADPTVMEQYVQTHYRLLDRISFGDHHRFSRKDIADIRSRLEAVNSEGHVTNDSTRRPIIVTTEKDAARLIAHPAVDDALRARIYYLPMEACFLSDAEAAAFDQQVLDFVQHRP